MAGGHGMWGLAHGPGTGRLLAEQITTGKQPEALREFDPLRRTGRQTCAASRSTPPVNHPVTGARVVRGGGLFRPAPDGNPFS